MTRAISMTTKSVMICGQIVIHMPKKDAVLILNTTDTTTGTIKVNRQDGLRTLKACVRSSRFATDFKHWQKSAFIRCRQNSCPGQLLRCRWNHLTWRRDCRYYVHTELGPSRSEAEICEYVLSESSPHVAEEPPYSRRDCSYKLDRRPSRQILVHSHNYIPHSSRLESSVNILTVSSRCSQSERLDRSRSIITFRLSHRSSIAS